MSSTVIQWTFIAVEYKPPAFVWELPPPIIKTEEFTTAFIPSPISIIEPIQYVKTAPINDRSFGEYLDDKKSEALSSIGEGIKDSVTQNLGDVAKEFGLWLLQVLPDSFGLLAMIFCLGAIASIPKMGKWTAISLVLAIIFEILRRATF
ncbi:hypothetical protein [Paenisporosarcina sp. OV554]|uniref:hypothetical protein n=1 Tax=Paenisporosarcina sp. OV554 TaxID=2135694 RepID=UPI000D3B0B95|nr:hypothetical protein [Paenisporosarcina sp. OV554]PUB09601.1 hypothetical protein C8K15_1274 [Paenisporosarcina sp. OV554]